MLQLILKFRAVIKPARAAASLQELSSLMAFYYSNHYCHLEFKWRTAPRRSLLRI